MIKLSTKGRYGLRAMIELAGSYGQGPLMMSEISRRQGVSRKYLHALLTSLKEAGLVRSQRGARGGYELAHPPEDILARDIFVALEGDIAVVDCVHDEKLCKRSEHCQAREVWTSLSEAMERVLTGVTLATLACPKKVEKTSSPPERAEAAAGGSD